MENWKPVPPKTCADGKKTDATLRMPEGGSCLTQLHPDSTGSYHKNKEHGDAGMGMQLWGHRHGNAGMGMQAWGFCYGDAGKGMQAWGCSPPRIELALILEGYCSRDPGVSALHLFCLLLGIPSPSMLACLCACPAPVWAVTLVRLSGCSFQHS